mmetsp:Transcript_17737/g.29163  ORF Transcript_17737/g.29163 Transcript_17737/m.29163 type:complete len:204 (-) Transcript_17737:651-1262(-)|eukprot:CAMPEP_0184658516 /NCGR_PEP_ID=MMETSP0308-20130426/25751_1 /TAXON_ID=38269 /ORGANISM="Gloeochaete witrockiana, Strain SAG 46.84" /LENGTH=203 /DNA_ID=CAMNT_0027097565 /DNA_START=68 /DNA_END=679 /DNA_ORIENTATION=-
MPRRQNSIRSQDFDETTVRNPSGTLFAAETASSNRVAQTNSEISSSIALQVFLYFNAYYSWMWLFLYIMLTIWRIAIVYTDLTWKVVTPILLFFWAISEAGRMSLGYKGNLQEKVPQLLGFFLITIIPQIPIAVFFMLFQNSVLPIDYGLNVVMLMFLAFEIVLSWRAIRRLIRAQAARFYLSTLSRNNAPERQNLVPGNQNE